MNYISQLNAFNERSQGTGLNPYARLVYYTLLDINNRLLWVAEFRTTSRLIASRVGIDKNAVTRALTTLINEGYIKYKPSKIRGKGSLVSIIPLYDMCPAIGTEMRTEIGTEIGTETGTEMRTEIGTLNKQDETRKKETKQENNSPNGELSPEGDEEASDKTPYKEIVEHYKRLCPSLPVPGQLTSNRRKTIKARWNNELRKDWDKLDEFLRAVEESDFLTARTGNWNGAGFDWIFKQANFNKIREGNYKNRVLRIHEPGKDRRDPAQVAIEMLEGRLSYE